MKRRKIWLTLFGLFIFGGTYFGWKLTARGAYESAAYRVVVSDGDFEIREYPDLVVASTAMPTRSESDNDSFMRLFRYISGGNEAKQKVAMTTPVFMEQPELTEPGQMEFVIPNEVASAGAPDPTDDSVQIRTREGGRFAVVRFPGRLDKQLKRLQDWIANRELIVDNETEVAGYDPPWTPGPMRRNEILIRVKQLSDSDPINSSEDDAAGQP